MPEIRSGVGGRSVKIPSLPPTEVETAAAELIADYWEKWAYLVQSGAVHRKIIAASVAGAGQIWWQLLGPWVRAIRDQDVTDYYESFEWLSAIVVTLGRPDLQ